MKLSVLNYLLAQEFVPTEPTLAIRIFDPDSTDDTDKGGNNPARKLVDSPLWVAQLTYTFEDIDLGWPKLPSLAVLLWEDMFMRPWG